MGEIATHKAVTEVPCILGTPSTSFYVVQDEYGWKLLDTNGATILVLTLGMGGKMLVRTNLGTMKL
jgi:hypothetical protein